MNEFYTNGRCQCNNGLYNISGICKLCPAGTTYSPLLLNCVSMCGGGQQWIDGKCSCPNGMYIIGNTCGQCQIGTFYIVQSSSCANICNLPNQVYSNGQCICTNGFILTNG